MADTPQSSATEEINVKVKTMQPATYELRIPLTATVGNLKQLLVDKASIPQDRQRIIYKGRVLDNDQQLQAHGVQEGHTLHLVERAPTAPSPAAGQAPQLPGQGQIPIAVGSMELDTEETDVNALLSSIFTQFGGQGGMPGIAAGEGAHTAGGNVDHQGGQEAQFIAQQLMSTLQGQAGQDFGMQVFGGMSGERRPNMLASIQTYLDKLQEIMQNPSVLLPSLSYPPGQEHELGEQRQLLEAVRGILTPAVRSALRPEQQAFLDAEASWQPPAPASGSSTRQNSATQRQSGAAQAAAQDQQNESAAQQATSSIAGDHTQQQAAEVNTTAGTAAASGNGTGAPMTNDDSSGPPGASSSAQDSLAQAQPFGSPVQPQSAPAQSESFTSAARASAAAAREAVATARQAASQAGESASQARESASTARQSASAARQSTSAARESASDGRSDDTSRRRRRRAAISPVVTMALGSLLQTTLEGDAFQDPANVLSNAAQLLLSTPSFEGDNRAQILANLRSAGSHLYRLAPLLMELARACSAAVAAMQGDAGPLALGSAHFIRPDGSRPAIGYTPASGQQFMTSSMSIPLFPGMPLGAMHLGPDGVRPTMAGPAPAANGPTSAAANRSGAASSAGPGAASGAGAGADANRAGQAIGLNIGTLLQSAFAGGGGGGQPNRPGVSIGESRQVIQVPGAPPVSIRFGNRPPGSHLPGSHPPGSHPLPLSQQSSVNCPVSLQVGNGTPVDLSPIIQRLGTMLGSAIQSAVSAASPSGPAQAATATATAAGPSGSHQLGQPAGTASAANAATAQTLLNVPVMQHLARALLHSLSPFISQAAPGAATDSIQTGTASAPTRNTVPASGSAGTTAPAAAGASGSGGGHSRPQPGLSDSLDAMIGMNPSADAFVSQMDPQGLIDALTQAGASSVNIQGPIALQGAGTAHSTTAQATAQAADVTSAAASSAAPALEAPSKQQLPVSEPAAGPASLLPSSQALPDPASASAAGPASGVTKPGDQRAVGLGSAALPPRDKGSKKSHPRSPTPVSTAPSADQSTSSRQSPGSRPAPSQPQQDNIKRARRGSSPPSEGLSQSAATAVGGVPSGAEPGAAASRGEAVEEVAQPNRGAVQASSAGGLDALMAGMFGGGGGSGGGGGLNLNSLMQVAGQMMSDPEVSRGVTGMIETLGQRAGGTRADQSEQSPQAGGGGADAGGGFGAIMQSLGPMMQQLAVGAGQSHGTGTQQVAGSAGGVSSSWQEALSELDEGERAEWECIIREDLEKQAGLAPERYKDHSTAYLAGKPPGAASTLLPSGSAASHDEDSD
ncbi:hypothetical protein WJX77_009390 [Trebouxia sp. C0004]